MFQPLMGRFCATSFLCLAHDALSLETIQQAVLLLRRPSRGSFCQPLVESGPRHLLVTITAAAAQLRCCGKGRHHRQG